LGLALVFKEQAFANLHPFQDDKVVLLFDVFEFDALDLHGQNPMVTP
jgi:hypothetical protein